MSVKQGPKGGAAAGKSKKMATPGAQEKREDVLQAVILADSFQDRFRPFSLAKPRCLLPIANVPAIEYTLEFLAANGVQEVFIYCGAHSEAIETYVHDSQRYSSRSIINPFSSIEFIRVSDATSVGDFLRDLDKRGLIGGDFILVHGDLVANIELDGALAKHRARREANRDACMTMVLLQVPQEHRALKSRVITPEFIIEPSTGRCLQYEERHPLQSDHYTVLDPALFKYPEFEIHEDLIDCGIDICTPEVLALWSESFDYELPRKNFLHGVLKDWELNGKLIYTEIMETGYAVRANSLAMYECVSRDVLGRWTFPYVPETNFVHGMSYKRVRDGSRLEDGVSISREAKVTGSVIGRSTEVGVGATISRSVIGSRCKIGKNVRIENSYIWDDTVIGDDSWVIRSILAESVEIGKDCRIPEGSLISYKVRIGDGQLLPPNPAPRLSLLQHDGSLAETDSSIVGQGGAGALYEGPIEEDDDESEDGDGTDPAALQNSLIFSLAHLNLSASSISTLASHDEFDSDHEESESRLLRPDSSGASRSRLSSFASDDSAAASSLDAFHSDAVHGLVDALRADDSVDFDSAKLEFMGLRLANNASDSSMRRAIAVAFVRRSSELLGAENGGLEPTKAAEEAFTSKRGAVRFIKEVGVGGDDTSRQSEFALALQKALLAVKGLEATRAGALLAAMLQQLYSLDVLEEEGILAWWGDKRAAENDSLAKIKEKCRVLVEWLENADEEESDEEDSD
ncbi:nucleotide-diphospho-sugar transferase [Lasiosphaeria miniovina]|uniref:Translation initiation factor eIF2B subunit epsilon n=1 Tax=Lasiosphaeria miniovina TaxID=1954250 RepID=A0AA40DRT2_9PEZI|nr:nucleotide-diphospho-sugar transferase [Lasiosphaeria miniovina]KAK0713809.1 nucleotide-diphospho-sugar transferase [Lasiosphaeria miniovina]